MQTRYQNRVSMGLAVLNVFAKHAADWNGNAALTANRATLAGLVQAIQDAASIQGSATSGVANGKNRRQIDLIQAILPIADDLHALADETGDSESAAKTALTFSALANLADSALGPRCQEILDLAAGQTAALADSGTSAADLAAAQVALQSYQPTATRDAIVDRATHTHEIEEGVRQLEAFLRNRLDKRMSKYATKAPPFFADYTSARKIIDLGIRHDPAAPAPAPVPKGNGNP